MNRNIRRIRRDTTNYIPDNTVVDTTDGFIIRRVPKTKCGINCVGQPTLAQRVASLENEIADINIALADHTNDINNQDRRINTLENVVFGNKLNSCGPTPYGPGPCGPSPCAPNACGPTPYLPYAGGLPCGPLPPGQYSAGSYVTSGPIVPGYGFPPGGPGCGFPPGGPGCGVPGGPGCGQCGCGDKCASDSSCSTSENCCPSPKCCSSPKCCKKKTRN